MDDFYAGEGTDNSGVPTKMITVNCSLLINVYNPSGMFGIHVRSSSVNLAFSQITVATGGVLLEFHLLFLISLLLECIPELIFSFNLSR